MRFVRFGLLLCFLSFNVSALAQQTQQTTTPLSATRDSQAVSVLNQALAVAGGIALFDSITDYVATGSISYNSASDSSGTVTLKGLLLSDFRMDVTLPSGNRSLVVASGTVVQSLEDGTINQSPSLAVMYPSAEILPYLHLATALKSLNFSLIYSGLVEMDGRTAFCIRTQFVVPDGTDPQGVTLNSRTRDFFIDSETFQVLATSDVLSRRPLVRQVHYSNYKIMNGALIPSTVSETLSGQPSWVVHLDQIAFNAGLQDSDFMQ